MENDFVREYKTSPLATLQQENQDKIKLIQLFVENDLTKIGKSTYLSDC